jgi:hypothetical protein
VSIGSVLNATPVGVLPQTLSTAFEEASAFLQLENVYHDGSHQCAKLVETPRHTFKLSKRLNSGDLAALLAFYNAHQGGLTPFYFYSPWEGSPVGSNWSAGGSSVTGRYTVVFRGDWSQVTDVGRTNVPQLELVEVA